MKDPTTNKLISAWLALSTAVCAWDASFLLLRPHSMPGGALAFFWLPYDIYLKFDLSYGLEHTNGFVPAQAVGNLIECALCVAYLYLVYGVGTAAARHHAVLVGVAATLMTGYKTVLFVLQEYFADFSSIAHNPTADILLQWVFPQTVFIVVPFYLTHILGDYALRRMAVADVADAAKKE
ncbi:uncharacterized protein V1510DRAFT_413958 [Dipodascopsis tothii]|uniref:uncharacterized protein n=1 Tax=Dipodascopsis tothii TaxID=44089 RepID=UPI0034CFA434